MLRRVAIAVSLLALVGAATGPALAKPKPKPKPITGSFKFLDPTADPTGNTGGDNHCNGVLPKEEAYQFKAPAAGSLEVVTEVIGDWALEIVDASGEAVATHDTNPPASESAFTKIKKAGTFGIRPCNIGGFVEAKVTYTFTFA